MTRDDFARFRHAYGGQEKHGTEAGFWPHEPLSRREGTVWFRKLQSYPLERLLAALEELYTQDRRHAPSIQQVIDALQNLAPPAVPVPDWQRAMARERGLTVPELLAAARPAHADKAIARGFREISDSGLNLRGQEAGFIAACERFAADSPADRAFWELQIAQKRQEVAARDTRKTPLPRQVGSFTHLGALLPKGRNPHA